MLFLFFFFLFLFQDPEPNLVAGRIFIFATGTEF